MSRYSKRYHLEKVVLFLFTFFTIFYIFGPKNFKNLDTSVQETKDWTRITVDRSDSYIDGSIQDNPKKDINVQEAKDVESSNIDIQSFDQKDKRLLEYIRKYHLFKPSELPYNFPNDTNFGELGGLSLLPSNIKEKPGFFLEAGAYNGKDASFTLALEVTYKWSGLLVECNPILVQQLKSLNRKAYVADVCLSKFTHPMKSELTSVDNWMAASSLGNSSTKLFPDFAKGFTKFQVQTIPLYSILAAAGATVVDFAVLDVQSYEFDVLKHFPFNLIFVKIWLVEIDLMSKKDKIELQRLMIQNLYHNELESDATDALFVHNSL